MVFLLSSSNNLQVLQEASMLKTLQPRGVTMPDLRSEGSGNASIQESTKLAVRVGDHITISDRDMYQLPVGEYELVDEARTVKVYGTAVHVYSTYRLRRIS